MGDDQHDLRQDLALGTTQQLNERIETMKDDLVAHRLDRGRRELDVAAACVTRQLVSITTALEGDARSARTLSLSCFTDRLSLFLMKKWFR
jgi:hypothetical protein